jgi:hypothetical protein
MATFYITVDGACQGKSEDIANMKERFSAIREDSDITDDPDRLRELFGDELSEIDDIDLEDGDSLYAVFGGLCYDWEDADVDSLEFSGYGEKHEPGKYVEEFISSIKMAFPRVQFHFISWCYISWGNYWIYREGKEGVTEYSWDEGDGGEDKKDAYVEWRLAFRRAWLLGEDAPEEEREAAKKAEDDAKADFLVKLASKTYEEWLDAVDENGFTLLKVPEDMKTEEMCHSAAVSIGKIKSEEKNMGYQVWFNMMGLEADIVSFWKQFRDSNDFGIEFNKDPSGARRTDIKLAEGVIDSLPDQEGFNDLFANFPAISFFIFATDYNDQGYWFGVNGEASDCEVYEGICDEDAINSALEYYGNNFCQYWQNFPRSIRTKEKALEYLQKYEDFRSDPDALGALPEEWLKDKEFCRAVLQLGESVVADIPKDIAAAIKKTAKAK